MTDRLALSGITNVRIVSSPSVLVLENETATIKVGDQIEIDGVECIITGIDAWGITTRPVTDAD
jgi:type II secretory pathway component GspD/PulD (secretin)